MHVFEPVCELLTPCGFEENKDKFKLVRLILVFIIIKVACSTIVQSTSVYKLFKIKLHFIQQLVLKMSAHRQKNRKKGVIITICVFYLEVFVCVFTASTHNSPFYYQCRKKKSSDNTNLSTDPPSPKGLRWDWDPLPAS